MGSLRWASQRQHFSFNLSVITDQIFSKNHLWNNQGTKYTRLNYNSHQGSIPFSCKRNNTYYLYIVYCCCTIINICLFIHSVNSLNTLSICRHTDVLSCIYGHTKFHLVHLINRYWTIANFLSFRLCTILNFIGLMTEILLYTLITLVLHNKSTWQFHHIRCKVMTVTCKNLNSIDRVLRDL